MDKPSPTNTNTTRRDFARVVEPLERASGRRLGNPHRDACFDVFQRYPRGVAAVAAATLVDARSNTLGLFVYRIAHDWAELEEEFGPLPAAPDRAREQTQARGRGCCIVCERWFDDALLCGGQWWCRDHESEAA